MLHQVANYRGESAVRWNTLRVLGLTAAIAGAIFVLIQVFPAALYRVLPTPAYLTFHTLLELASILVSFAIFAVNWQASHRKQNTQNLFIGTAFLTIAIFDTMHTLSYAGMPDFVSSNSVGKAIVYWLAGRFTEAVTLLAAAFLLAEGRYPWLRRWPLLTFSLVTSAGVFVATTYFWDYLPAMYVTGQGLTPLKVGLEYLVVALNLAALAAYWLTSRGRPQPQVVTLMAALVLVVFAELAFTLYQSAYDSYNLLGHLYKVVAYSLIFRSLFVSSVEHPYLELATANEELASTSAELRRRNVELAERYAQLEALSSLSAEVASSLDLRKVCDSVLGHCCRLTGAQYGFLSLLNETGGLEVVSVQLGGRECPLGNLSDLPAKHLQGLLGAVIASGKAVLSNDVSRDSRAAGFPPGHLPVESYLGVPLVARTGGVIGLIGLANRVDGFQIGDEWLVNAFAHQTAVAIENARLHEAERRLVELERLRTIVNQMPTGVLMCDARGRITLANRAAEDLLRWPVPYGRPLEMHPGALHLFRPAGDPYPWRDLPLSRALARGEAVSDVEVAIEWPNGQRRTLLFSAAPLVEGQGSAVGAVGVCRDISDVKELERQKDEFLSIAAHELKSPLTSAKGYAQLLLRKVRDREEGDSEVRALKVIDHQIGRVVDLVNQLLDISRLEMGRLDLECHPTDVVGVTRRIIEQFKVTSARHELVLETSAPEVVGCWDRGRLEQVLSNLVSNAIKYSPEGGRVEVTIFAHQGEVRVSVRDRGLGIPPEAQEHVFDRYYRVDRKTKVEGLGLGLYITREIVMQLGGRIWVESEPGQGSTFHFVLPLEPPGLVLTSPS